MPSHPDYTEMIKYREAQPTDGAVYGPKTRLTRNLFIVNISSVTQTNYGIWVLNTECADEAMTDVPFLLRFAFSVDTSIRISREVECAR